MAAYTICGIARSVAPLPIGRDKYGRIDARRMKPDEAPEAHALRPGPIPKLEALLLLLISYVLCAGAWAAAPVAEPLNRDALKVRSIERAVLLAAAVAGQRIVAVGERGIVALSDDTGRTWRQAQRVPVSVTLTAVRFVNDRQGWAVGHAGVVLHSEDAGENWSRQLDGVALAQLALRDAQANLQRTSGNDVQAQRMVREAELLVKDGPDKPFFDLEFSDSSRGIVVGAYNLIFATSDGGQSWQPLMSRTDNAKSLHLYAVRRKGDAIYIAGEQGLLLRSSDAGLTFTRSSASYRGSWFALALPNDGSIVVAGLRGNAYRSIDNTQSWTRLTDVGPISFVSATSINDRGVVLANQAGRLFAVADAQSELRMLPGPALPTLTSLLPLPDGNLLALTIQGPIVVQISSPSKAQPPTSSTVTK